MELDDSVDNRLTVVAKVMDSPPAVHPRSPNGVWSTARSCYNLWRITFGEALAPSKRVLDFQPSSLLLGDVIIWLSSPIPARQRL
jgi:hypothetical protein